MPQKPGQYRPKSAKTAKYAVVSRGNSAERGYDDRWRKYRLSFLADHPLCVECRKAGMVVEATVVDHIVPHRGDYELFWEPANHQPLCERHHNRKTRSGR